MQEDGNLHISDGLNLPNIDYGEGLVNHVEFKSYLQKSMKDAGFTYIDSGMDALVYSFLQDGKNYVLKMYYRTCLGFSSRYKEEDREKYEELLPIYKRATNLAASKSYKIDSGTVKINPIVDMFYSDKLKAWCGISENIRGEKLDPTKDQKVIAELRNLKGVVMIQQGVKGVDLAPVNVKKVYNKKKDEYEYVVTDLSSSVLIDFSPK